MPSPELRSLLSKLVFLTLPLAVIYGCTPPSQEMKAPPPDVLVGTPVVREITDFEEFPGQIQAVKTIVVRPRVTGYLDRVMFKEGTEVREGEPLFVIDQRTYQALFEQAQANLLQARAHLARLEADYKRAETLVPTRAISQEDFDKVAGDRAEAAAGVKVAEASLQSAKLNLDFTVVTAKISGRISRQLIDPGNLARADETPLTTIVSLDPMYAYFDVDERTMLRVRRLIRDGKVRSARETEVKVLLGLVDEQGFPHEGTIDFIENQLDASSGTLRLRGRFPNPKGILSPGMFVRIRVPIGDPHQAILVSERALGADQGEKFIYVVDDDNKAIYRRVQVGALWEGLRVIESGLTTSERVILSGLQRVKAGGLVNPKVISMTGDESEASADASKPDVRPGKAQDISGGTPDADQRPSKTPKP